MLPCYKTWFSDVGEISDNQGFCHLKTVPDSADLRKQEVKIFPIIFVLTLKVDHLGWLGTNPEGRIEKIRRFFFFFTSQISAIAGNRSQHIGNVWNGIEAVKSSIVWEFPKI